MKVIGVIPARMASTRFPNKPIVDIGGISMIQRVYEQAKKSSVLSKLLVATDHDDIFKEVKSFGGEVVMTSVDHKNGTERCAEVLEILDEEFDVLINIQGDEPFFEPKSLEILIDCFQDETTQISTLVKEVERSADLVNPSVVKTVFTKNNKALYFSRAAIPFQREAQGKHFKHIGIYAFKTSVLPNLVKLPMSDLEKSEQLEQLRWLQNDYRISIGFTKHDSNSVDTPEDLIALKEQFNIKDE